MTAGTFGSVYIKLESLSWKLADAAKEAVKEVVNETKEDSQENYCPVDTGYLKSTCTLSETDSGGVYSAVIEYGADYAIYVHE